MLFLAGHLPTKRFTLAELQAMPHFPPESLGLPPFGHCWTYDDRGRIVVGYIPPDDDGVDYAVRPIVVVRAG